MLADAEIAEYEVAGKASDLSELATQIYVRGL